MQNVQVVGTSVSRLYKARRRVAESLVFEEKVYPEGAFVESFTPWKDTHTSVWSRQVALRIEGKVSAAKLNIVFSDLAAPLEVVLELDDGSVLKS